MLLIDTFFDYFILFFYDFVLTRAQQLQNSGYSNKLYLAMAGVDLLLPLYKINKEKTIQLLCQLIRRYPNIIEGTESWEIIDYAIIDYYKDFYKLFNDKSLLFSDKSIKNLSNKYICYYIFYGLFANKTRVLQLLC